MPHRKAWATAVSKENVPTVQSYAFSFLRGRRRGAVLAQQVAAWKTKRAGRCCATNYHDMRSAFASTFVDEPGNTVEEIYTEADTALQWRHSGSIITIETEIGRQVGIFSSGGLIGDTACPK